MDYSSRGFWDEFYFSLRKEDDPEWLLSFEELQEQILDLLPRRNVEVLIPGCGKSNLPARLVENGFRHLTCIDFAPNVISEMKERHSALELDWIVMDALEMGMLPSSCFDIVLDKGLVDSVVCSEQSSTCMQRLVEGMHRVLRENGLYILISHGKPATRIPYFLESAMQYEHVETIRFLRDKGDEPVFMFVLKKTND